MKRHLLATLVAAAPSAFALTGPSGPTALGAIDNASVVVGDTVPAAPFFLDTYSFLLGAEGDVFGGLYAVDIGGIGAVLRDASQHTLAVDFNALDGFSFEGLAAGGYTLSFIGWRIGANAAYGGVVSALAAAVPEPETLALMLAGLGATLFILRRRVHS